MAPQSDLTRTLASGTGIVISILLAFAIDASWEARSDRLAEEAIIEGLRGDFEANLLQIDELWREHLWADTTLARFFDSAVPDSEAEAEDLVQKASLGLQVGSLLDPTMGSLEMLLSSGRAELTSRPDLLAVLWQWKMQVEDLEDDAWALQNNVRDSRLLLGRLGVRGINSDLFPPWREQVGRLRSSPELSSQARTATTNRRGYREELMALRATTELVLAAIE